MGDSFFRYFRYLLAGLWVIYNLGACSRHVYLHSDAVEDRKKIPVMHTENVMTLISDSGIVRYRIKSKTWDIFDKADTPYWDFPDGIYLEKFGEDFSMFAQLEADKAVYNQKDEIWRLDGNVKIMNEIKEHFYTERLLWYQKDELISSDTLITIIKANSVINGIGFRSNPAMTQYTILQPTGSFPIDKNE